MVQSVTLLTSHKTTILAIFTTVQFYFEQNPQKHHFSLPTSFPFYQLDYCLNVNSFWLIRVGLSY